MNVRSSTAIAQRILRWLIVIGVFLLVGLGIKTVIDDITKPKMLVSLAGATFQVDVAQTDDELQKGLAGRSSLASDEAMLFEFPRDDTWGIWMKGMKFPIDIIWLDSNKQVVYVKSNVQLDAEPYELYEPPVPARYVLEMAAGGVDKFKIKKGQIATIYSNKETD